MRGVETMRYILAIVTLFLLTSCSTLSKEECEQGNWRGIGHKDAIEGKAKTVFNRHQSACGEVGIQVNRAEYMEGYKKGLEDFCKPKYAYEFGLNGGLYRETCPLDKVMAFKSAYNKGREVHALKNELSSLNNEIDRLNNEIVRSTTAEHRAGVMYKLREKERKKSEIEKKLLVIELKNKYN